MQARLQAWGQVDPCVVLDDPLHVPACCSIQGWSSPCRADDQVACSTELEGTGLFQQGS